MRYAVKILMCFALAPQALAEPDEPDKPKNRIYNEHSQLSVDNINEATRIIRDPTQMSPNFRQAIKNIAPSVQANAPSAGRSGGGNTLPAVALTGKVLTPGRPPSAVLHIHNHTFHIREGDSTSMIYQDSVLTVRVDEITDRYVKLMLVELNRPMILQ